TFNLSYKGASEACFSFDSTELLLFSLVFFLETNDWIIRKIPDPIIKNASKNGTKRGDIDSSFQLLKSIESALKYINTPSTLPKYRQLYCFSLTSPLSL